MDCSIRIIVVHECQAKIYTVTLELLELGMKPTEIQKNCKISVFMLFLKKLKSQKKINFFFIIRSFHRSNAQHDDKIFGRVESSIQRSFESADFN